MIGSEIGDTADVVVDDATRAAMDPVVALPNAMTKIAFAPPDDDANPVGAPTPVETARPFSPFGSPTPLPEPANQPTPNSEAQPHDLRVADRPDHRGLRVVAVVSSPSLAIRFTR